MDRVRRVLFGWLWRGGACVTTLGYFFGVCAIGALNPPPHYHRLPTAGLVATMGVSFTVAVVGHRLLLRRWRRWKPTRSLLATTATAAAVVALIPLAVVCWPVTVFVFFYRRGSNLTVRQRQLGLAYMTHWFNSQR